MASSFSFPSVDDDKIRLLLEDDENTLAGPPPQPKDPKPPAPSPCPAAAAAVAAAVSQPLRWPTVCAPERRDFQGCPPAASLARVATAGTGAATGASGTLSDNMNIKINGSVSGTSIDAATQQAGPSSPGKALPIAGGSRSSNFGGTRSTSDAGDRVVSAKGQGSRARDTGRGGGWAFHGNDSGRCSVEAGDPQTPTTSNDGGGAEGAVTASPTKTAVSPPPPPGSASFPLSPFHFFAGTQLSPIATSNHSSRGGFSNRSYGIRALPFLRNLEQEEEDEADEEEEGGEEGVGTVGGVPAGFNVMRLPGGETDEACDMTTDDPVGSERTEPGEVAGGIGQAWLDNDPFDPSWSLGSSGPSMPLRMPSEDSSGVSDEEARKAAHGKGKPSAAGRLVSVYSINPGAAGSPSRRGVLAFPSSQSGTGKAGGGDPGSIGEGWERKQIVHPETNRKKPEGGKRGSLKKAAASPSSAVPADARACPTVAAITPAAMSRTPRPCSGRGVQGATGDGFLSHDYHDGDQTGLGGDASEARDAGVGRAADRQRGAHAAAVKDAAVAAGGAGEAEAAPAGKRLRKGTPDGGIGSSGRKVGGEGRIGSATLSDDAGTESGGGRERGRAGRRRRPRPAGKALTGEMVPGTPGAKERGGGGSGSARVATAGQRRQEETTSVGAGSPSPGPAVVADEELQSQNPCTCKRCRCLKLYCECFAHSRFCGPACLCVQCCNRQNAAVLMAARRSTLQRKPDAFALEETPSTVLEGAGCGCTKSQCLKKYCICFQKSVRCGASCKCEGCMNTVGSRGPKNAGADSATPPQQPRLLVSPGSGDDDYDDDMAHATLFTPVPRRDPGHHQERDRDHEQQRDEEE